MSKKGSIGFKKYKLYTFLIGENIYSYFNLDKSIHVLFATFQSQAPDPGSGGLKIWRGVSPFCAVKFGFPTMGASFE